MNLPATVIAALLLATTPAPPAPVPSNLLQPLPRSGAVPPIVPPSAGPSFEDLEARAKLRNYEGQIRAIVRKHFRRGMSVEQREEGFRRLREFIDPAAFLPMAEVLGGESEDLRAFLINFLAEQGDDGQAALAPIAIHGSDPAIRNAAVDRIVNPAPDAVLRVIDRGLRDNRHAVANASATLAASLDALSAIPLLIFAQATEDPVRQRGDLAWIAIGTSRSYVANVVPVVGNNAGAFQPVLGVVYEGTLLRVMDAVAVNYRIDVHNALVAMTSNDIGQSTADLGYNLPAWYAWFNEVYVPFKQNQQRIIDLAQQAADPERT